VDEGSKIVNISEIEAKNDFLLPKLVKSNYKKEKEFISLIGENINDKTLRSILDSSPNSRNLIRYLELPDNQITSIDFICKNFTNLNKLVLSRNRIADIEDVAKLINLQQLNIRDNLIEELPPALFGLFKTSRD
jgi:Leucine-rich repeat (LRR) protein